MGLDDLKRTFPGLLILCPILSLAVCDKKRAKAIEVNIVKAKKLHSLIKRTLTKHL